MLRTHTSDQGVVDTIVESRYDIGRIYHWQELRGGMFLVPVLVVAEKGRFVLRAHSFRADEQVFRFQAEAVEQLAELGVWCPRVVRDRAGRWGVNRESVFWALHEYIEGRQYSWEEWHKQKQISGFLPWLGLQIARIHSALALTKPGGEGTFTASFPPIQFLQLRGIREQWDRTLNRLSEDDNLRAPKSVKALLHNRCLLEKQWDFLETSAESFELDRLPRQLVHGDVSPVNMIFSKSNERVALIDWDFLHLGHRLYDALGDALNRLPLQLAKTPYYDLDEVRCYLSGYQEGSRPPLSQQELRCVPVFAVARQLEDLRQRIRVLSRLTADKDTEYACLIEGRIKMADQIIGRLDQFTNLG